MKIFLFKWQGSYALPSNFEEVATGVLKVLNNLALIDINFIQMMLVSIPYFLFVYISSELLQLWKRIMYCYKIDDVCVFFLT